MQERYQNKSVGEGDNALSALLFKYLPYWPLFVAIIIIFIGGAFLYLGYATPQYEADASLMIKNEKKGNDDSKLIESLNILGTKKIVENEIEILQSRSLMNKVVSILHLYAPVYKERKFKAVEIYETSPITIEAANPDEIEEIEKISFTINPKNGFVVLNKKERFNLNQWVLTPYGKLKFSENRSFNKFQTKQAFYFSLVQPKKISNKLLKSLKVSASNKLATIIDLSLRDAVPRRAEDILNELINAYNQAAITDKNTLAANTLAFVDDRLNAVTHELDSIERAIQKFKSGSGAIDISTQGKLFLQNVSENDQKLSDVNMKIAVLDKVEKFIETGDKSGSIIPSTLGISDPVLSQLLEKLYNYELEYEKLKNTVAENNPILLTVKDQIKKIRPNIVQNIQSQRASLMAGKGNLSSTNGGYNSMLQAIPRKERELLEISREQSIKSNIYAFLLQKREESAISSAAAVSDVKVIDLAQSSSDPVSPNKKIVYLISFIAALAFVVGLITLREALNRTILYRKDIEALTDVTVIGEVSYQNVTNPIVVEDGKRTVIAEDFRKIRASLPFLGIGTNKKKILVTSSIPGEGKSFVAVNLAQTLALTGKKVVLVDMDLNKPSLGVIINSDAKNGVSEYLSNQTELEEIIRRTQVNENLFFVSAGALPPNPSELLSNGKVKSLIKYLENSFDYVIIDSAPTTPVSDAFLLTNYCDSTLFVIRHRYTPKMLIRRLDETIRINPLINTAIIFNGVRDRGFVKNNYGYGYGYVYKYSIDNANQKA